MFKFVEILNRQLDETGVRDEALTDSWYSAKMLPIFTTWSRNPHFVEFRLRKNADDSTRGVIVANMGKDRQEVFHDVADVSVLSPDKTLGDLGLIPLIRNAAPAVMGVDPAAPGGDQTVESIEHAAKKYRVRQHRPGSIDSEEPLVDVEVSSLEELLALPFVAKWNTDRFDRFSLSVGRDDDHGHLMADMADGESWVVARIDPTSNGFNSVCNLDLPAWVKDRVIQAAPAPTSYWFEEGGNYGTPEKFRTKFEFTTLKELTAQPFIRGWTSKPDFVRLAIIPNIDGITDCVQLVSVVNGVEEGEENYGHWVLGEINVIGNPVNVNRCWELPYFTVKPVDDGSVDVLNNIPGVKVTERPVLEEVQMQYEKDDEQELIDRLDSMVHDEGKTVLAAFYEIVLGTDGSGSRVGEVIGTLACHITSRYSADELLGDNYADERMGALRWKDVQEEEVEYRPANYVSRSWISEVDRSSFGNTYFAEQFFRANPERFTQFVRFMGWEVEYVGPVAVVNTYAHILTVLDGCWLSRINAPHALVSTSDDKTFVETYRTLESAIAQYNGEEPRKIITVELDPADKDPEGTVRFIMQEAGFAFPEPEESVEEEEAVEVDEEVKKDLLMQLQNTFLSPEATWDDLLNALMGCKRAGCYTPGQFIEADGSDILDEALRQEDEGGPNILGRVKEPHLADQLRDHLTQKE